jgi:hypothetical protein
MSERPLFDFTPFSSSMADMPDRPRAKQIIVEIIRLHGGEIPTKTSLFKAFYFSHLYYAKSAAGYLSDWPIVRMPNGPGIDDADRLLDELIEDGTLALRQMRIGPYDAICYRLLKNAIPENLSLDEIEAIKTAVDFVKGKTAGELSSLTHEFSRSWRLAEDGEELNIYIDLEPEEQYVRRMKAFDKFDRAIAEVWPAVQS